jgi:hypothetical protein
MGLWDLEALCRRVAAARRCPLSPKTLGCVLQPPETNSRLARSRRGRLPEGFQVLLHHQGLV